jgi:hypothetical protein
MMVELTVQQREYLKEIHNEVYEYIELMKETTPHQFVVLETKLKQILNTGQYHFQQRKYLNEDIKLIRDRLTKERNVIDDWAADMAHSMCKEIDKLILEQMKLEAMKWTIMGIPSNRQGK